MNLFEPSLRVMADPNVDSGMGMVQVRFQRSKSCRIGDTLIAHPATTEAPRLAGWATT